MKISIKLPVIMALATVLTATCGNQANNDAVDLTSVLALTQGGGLSGTAMKGPVRNAYANVYQLESDGSRGPLLAGTVTDSQGRFRFRHRFRDQRIEIEIEEGEYTDEASGATVQLQAQTRLRLQLAANEDHGEVVVSPLTTMAAERTRARLQAGEPSIDAVLVQARLELANLFGLETIDPGRTGVDDLTDPAASAERNRAQTRYGLVLAALSQVMADRSLGADQLPALIGCYCADASDGAIDDSAGGEPVVCPAGISAQEAHSYMNQALNNFMVNIRNRHRETLAGMSMPSMNY